MASPLVTATSSVAPDEATLGAVRLSPRVSLVPRLARIGLTSVVVAAGLAAASARAQPMPPMRRPPEFMPPPVVRVSPRVTGNPFVRGWRSDDYNGGSSNTSVVQHPRTGYIYIGNSDGVLEFDGAHWRLIPLPKQGGVETVAVDGEGRVWLGSTREIARLEPDGHGALRAVTVVDELPGGDFDPLGEAIATPDGVWFGGLQNILRVGPHDVVARWHTAERFGLIWWMEGAIHTAISDREVVRLEENGQMVQVLSRADVPTPPERPNPLQVFAARATGGGEWQLLTALGPVRWHRARRTWRIMPEAMPFFRDALAVGGLFLADGGFALSLARPGIALFQADGRLEQIIDRMPAAMNSRMTHLAEDSEGGLWLPARERIMRLDLRQPFARHEAAQGLQGGPRQVVRSQGQLFVAHTEGVAGYREWPGFFPPAVGLLRGAESLAVVNGRLFAAVAGLVEVYPNLQTQVWSNFGVTALAATRQGPTGLFAGDAQGMWLFQPDGEAWRPAGRVENVRGTVDSIHDSGDGWVWAANTEGHVLRADFRAGRRLDAPVRTYAVAQGVPAAPPGARIRFFTLGSTLLATCAHWLLRYEPAADRFVPENGIPGFTAAARLGAEAVAMNVDGSAWLRLGMPDRRLLRVAPDETGFKVREIPAMLLRQMPAVGLFEDASLDTLWISTADALISADLGWRAARPAPAPVPRLRRITNGNGNEVLWGDSQDPGAGLALDHGQTALRFEYTAPIFSADHRGRPLVSYRTRLDGLDAGWTDWSAEPRRDFTNLPYRSFTFRVQVRDQFGRESAAATLPFRITPPWWLARGAVAGYVLVGLTALGGIIKLRTRALRRHAAQLEATVAARTAELADQHAALLAQNEELAILRQLEADEKIAARLAEEKARLQMLRYQLNPHFLYNALNSVYGLVLTTPRAAADMVLRLADFCRATLTPRENESTTLAACFERLTLYLNIEKVRWNDSLHVEISLDDAARDAWIPPFLLQPLVENAIKYGGNTSPDDLRVRLSARLEAGENDDPGTLQIEVANSGEWVEPAANGHAGTGIGLANLRQRLRQAFPDAHELRTETGNGWVIVRLTLRLAGSTLPSPAALGTVRVLH